ncbi:putative FAD-binding dehydrogenase [Roseimaritima ulvae]|uniref:Putative FAD-binding dehydrogenase n=1 Tax=Roseimaritima ulvae TaxID=980254 RepID=A0A5B9QKH4_9BACT|nr:FAD-dependent oxidoreductase [Roseimaritima ulvae]QEG38090.1 putative FAD-binding dehydrogenase [Roseimaritima ulvae]
MSGLGRLAATVIFLAGLYANSAAAAEPDYDVVIYGATPAGIASAVAAGKSGRSVLLVEPTNRIGGLVTSGLSHTDFHSLESLSGAFWDFANRVERHYAQTYGADSQQVRESFHGTFAEPKVNLAVFQQLLKEQTSVEVIREHALTAVDVREAEPHRHIQSATFADASGNALTVRGRVFIDGSYEGDLMAMAGVEWRAGREGRDEHGESLAPETADDQLQAYNFRFIMTREEANRVKPVAPPGYRREDFVGVLQALQTDQIQRVFDYPSKCIFKAHLPVLPGGKYDINDVSRSLVRLSLPGKNLGWPDGTREERQAIYAEHLRDQAGLLYFLQNDPEVPEKFQQEALQWGWCRDEFLDTNHLPPQLYVREARRMQGVYVYTQADSEFAEEGTRAVFHGDSIAMADYGNNCHGTHHEGPRFGGKHTGEFYNPVPPYQIPYGVLLPKDVDNLLVPGAVSSSHVGFCALRLEPIWMSLGQAAGHAAALAVQDAQPVQQVDVSALQRRLHADGSATMYVSDVLPDSADFEVVQWWAAAGGLQHVYPADTPRKARGKKLHGQYTEAAPGHAAELDKPLDAELEQHWRKLAAKLGVPVAALPTADGKTTRGDFIRAAAKK